MNSKWIFASLLLIALLEPALAARPGHRKAPAPPAPSSSEETPSPAADAIREKREKLASLNQEEKDVQLQIFRAHEAQKDEAAARAKGPRYVFQRGPSNEEIFLMQQHLKDVRKQIAGLRNSLKKKG